MTEIDEVAAAIYAKYQLAWPLNRAQAATLAGLEASDQGQNIIAAIAECLFNYNAKRDDQQEFDIVGQIEKLANPGPTAPFTAQLFDLLASALKGGSVVVYQADGEIFGRVESSWAVGDWVRLSVPSDLDYEFDLEDQPVTVQADGSCIAVRTNRISVMLLITMNRPVRASDLEKPDGTGN